MKKITVIIVFLNEGIEVLNTLRSIRRNSNKEEVDILLVDDASNDSYDYKSITKTFNAVYHKHKKRIGAAESRNEGINLIETEYFILLDAHMRIYQKDWVSILFNSLNINKRSILCCQTIPLDNSGKKINTHAPKFGAYIDFEDLSVKWNNIDFYVGQAECVASLVHHWLFY